MSDFYFFLNIFFRPLVYTISVLLPAAYLIGLIFTLKTHSHIYDIHISDGQPPVGASVSQATAGASDAQPLAANSCINSSPDATSQVAVAGLDKNKSFYFTLYLKLASEYSESERILNKKTVNCHYRKC